MTKQFVGTKKAFSDDRILEICSAIETWFKGLGINVSKAARTIGASRDALRKWINAENAPEAYFMEQLYKETDNPVFLLLESEKAIFMSKGRLNTDGTARHVGRSRSKIRDKPASPKKDAVPRRSEKPRDRSGPADINKIPVKARLSQARIQEIAEAIRNWYHSLPKPRPTVAKERIHVTSAAVNRWIDTANTGRFPQLGSMINLFHDSSNPIFLLTTRERKLVTERNKAKLPVDYPSLEAWKRSVQKKTQPRKEPTPQREEIDLASDDPPLRTNMPHVAWPSLGSDIDIDIDNVVEMILRSAGTQIYAIVEMINKRKATGELAPVLRRDAQELIDLLTETFDLQVRFDEPDPEQETDPEVLRTLKKVLGSTTDNEGETK